MNNSENLTLQQQRFCDEYLVSFNAYRAALSAGYSDNTARKGEMLHLPKVQEYLKAAMNKTADRLQITHDMVLRELAKVAFSNIGNYYDETGAVKPMYALSDDDKAALNDYQLSDAVNEHGERIGIVSRIKMHNKMSALDKIARHIGFYGVSKEVVSGELRVADLERTVVSGELQVAGFEETVVSDELRVAGFEETVVSDELRVAGFEKTVVNGELLVASEQAEATVGEASCAPENVLTLSPQREPCTDGDGNKIEREILTLSPLTAAVVVEEVKNAPSGYQPPMRIFENRNKPEKKYAVASDRGSYSFKRSGQ